MTKRSRFRQWVHTAAEAIGAQVDDGGEELRLYIHATGGRDQALGTLPKPLRTWAGVADRLRYLHTIGRKRVCVRVLDPNLGGPLNADRIAITDLEKLGMAIRFEKVNPR